MHNISITSYILILYILIYEISDQYKSDNALKYSV